MPRPVCGRCQREMTLTRAVVVQFNALSVGGPYEQWMADEAVCDGCNATVITRYAHEPFWRHHFGAERPRAESPAYIIHERPLEHALNATVRPRGAVP